MSLNTKNAGPLTRGPVRAGRFAFPEDVEGWLSEEEGCLLYEQARQSDGAVVELGSYQGRSTICLAQGSSRVFAIDHMLGDAADNIPGGYEERLRANLACYGVSNRVTIIRGDTGTAAAGFREPVTLLFVDGDHRRSLRDVLAWLPLKPIVIALHDRWTGDVPQTIRRLQHLGYSEIASAGSLAVMRRD